MEQDTLDDNPLHVLDGNAAKRRRIDDAEYFINVAGTVWKLPHSVWSRIPAIEASQRHEWAESGSKQKPDEILGSLPNVTPAGFKSLFEFLNADVVPSDPQQMKLFLLTANALSMSLGTVSDAAPQFRKWKWWSCPSALEPEIGEQPEPQFLVQTRYQWIECVAVDAPREIFSASSTGEVECIDLYETDHRSDHRSLTVPTRSRAGQFRVRCIASIHTRNDYGYLSNHADVICGCDDGTVQLWTGDYSRAKEYTRHTGRVNCVADLGENRFVSGSADHTVIVWTVEGNEGDEHVFEDHEGPVLCLKVFHGIILSGSQDGGVVMRNVRGLGALGKVLVGHEGPVRSISACANNIEHYRDRTYDSPRDSNSKEEDCLHVVSGSDDCMGMVWKVKVPELTSLIHETRRRHEDSKQQLIALDDMSDPYGIEGYLQFKKGDMLLGTMLESQVFLNDGHGLDKGEWWKGENLKTGQKGYFRVEDVTSTSEIEADQVLDGHRAAVTCVLSFPIEVEQQEYVVTASGLTVTGSDDMTLKMWRWRGDGAYKCVQTLVSHTGPVMSLTSLHDRRLVSGSADTTVKVWDSETGTLLTTLQQHREPVFSVAEIYNQGASVIVSASEDGIAAFVPA